MVERKGTMYRHGKKIERKRTPAVAVQHCGFWLETPEGHDAHILGDRKMPARTRKALGAMIDAAVKAAESGKLEVLPNLLGDDL